MSESAASASKRSHRATAQFPVAAISTRRSSSARSELLFRRRPALRRARADGARGRRLPRPAAGGRGPRAGAHARRAYELRLATSAATARRSCSTGRGNTGTQHRLPAAPLDLRPHGRAARRAALRRRPVPEPRQLPAAELERPAVRRPARRPQRNVAADLGRIGPRADLDFSGYVLDRVEMHECDYNWKTFIEVYLEDYHVEPVPPGAGQLRQLRRPALGVRRRTTRCRPSAPQNEPGQGRARRSTASWHDAVLRYRDGAAARSTARSG